MEILPDKGSTYSFYMVSFNDKGMMRDRKKLNPAFVKKFKKISLKGDGKDIEVYKTKKDVRIKTK